MIAKAMSLDYESVIAEPDSKSFFRCIHEQNTSVNITINDIPAMKTLEKKWRAAVEASLTKKQHRVLETHVKDIDPDISDIKQIRMCARNQNLRVDAEEVAAKLLHFAQAASCGPQSVISAKYKR